jgi:hypothetical protein
MLQTNDNVIAKTFLALRQIKNIERVCTKTSFDKFTKCVQ